MKAVKWPSFGLLFILGAGFSQATTTFNLSTGTATYNITSDTNGGLDADYTGTAIDVTSLPGAPFAHIANGLSNGYNTAVWVGPNANQSSETNTVTGTTVYTVTFDLTGFYPASSQLVISLGADDYVTSVLLNSTSIFAASGTQISGGMYATAVTVPTVTSGFISGINTLTFTVANFTGDGATSCCGPTGLIAAVDVIASVPEPGTVGTTSVCLLGLTSILYRRRNSIRRSEGRTGWSASKDASPKTGVSYFRRS
jgi:hypothetical protein